MILATLAMALAQPCTVTDGDSLSCVGGKLRLEGVNTADGPRSPVCRTAALRRTHWCNKAMSDRATAAMRRWVNRGPYVVTVTGHCDFYGRQIGTLRRGPEDVRDVLLAGELARVDRRNYRERRCG